jgi:hypothetical protein
MGSSRGLTPPGRMTEGLVASFPPKGVAA